MKTFKEFVAEVARSPERAIKLGNYLQKKSHDEWQKEPSDYVNNKMKISSNHKLFKNVKQGRDDAASVLKVLGKSKAFDQSYTPANIKNVKISNLIPMQAHTDWNPDKAKEKLEDNEPISVIHHQGKMYVYNGHHRVVAHRLLGKTHIDANVQTIKKD
jgi:hypothetical protein